MITLLFSSRTYDDVMTISALVGMGTVGVGAYVRLSPRVKERRAKQQARDDAILGRPAVLDSITGEEIAPELPALGVRLARMETDVRAITHEIHPNGGTSIKDSVGRIEQRLTDGDERFERIEEHMRQRDEADAGTKRESEQIWAAINHLRKIPPPPPAAVVVSQTN